MGLIDMQQVLLVLIIWVYRIKTKNATQGVGTDVGSYSDLARLLGLGMVARELAVLFRNIVMPAKSTEVLKEKTTTTTTEIVSSTTTTSKVFVPELFAIDLDGTLCDDKGKITVNSEQALEKYLQLGGNIVFATGQPIYAARKTLHAFISDEKLKHYNTYCICSGGSLLVHVPSWSVQQKYEISKATVSKLLEGIVANVLKKLQKDKGGEPFFMCVETAEKLLVNNDKFFPTVDLSIPGIGAKLESVSKVFDFGDKPELFASVLDGFGDISGALRLLFVSETISSEDLLLHFRKTVSAMKLSEDVVVNHAGINNAVEISPHSVTKGHTLKDFVLKHGFHRNKVVAFGDRDNDIEMLKYAGVGIAVCNAEVSLKRVAIRLLDESNEEEGVAKELTRMVSRIDPTLLIRENLKTKERMIATLEHDRRSKQEKLNNLNAILDAGLSLEKKMRAI